MIEIDNERFLLVLDSPLLRYCQPSFDRPRPSPIETPRGKSDWYFEVRFSDREVRTISAEWSAIVSRTCILPSAIALQMSIFASFFDSAAIRPARAEDLDLL